MEYEKKYNNLIARINEVKEKPSLCMKDKHHYNGYVETGIRDALDYIVRPESEDERIRKQMTCKWYRNGGECGKGLPGTPCELAGCVAWEQHKED